MAYDNGCALPLKASLALRAVRAPCDRELCNTNTVGIAYHRTRRPATEGG